MSKDAPVLRTRQLVPHGSGPGDLASCMAFMTSPRSRHIGGPVGEVKTFRRFATIFGHWRLRGGGPLIPGLSGTAESIGPAGWLRLPDWPGPEVMWQIWPDRYEDKGWVAKAAAAARAHMRNAWGLSNLISLIATGNAHSEGLALRHGAYQDARFRTEDGSKIRIWRHPFTEEPDGVLSRRAA